MALKLVTFNKPFAGHFDGDVASFEEREAAKLVAEKTCHYTTPLDAIQRFSNVKTENRVEIPGFEKMVKHTIETAVEQARRTMAEHGFTEDQIEEAAFQHVDPAGYAKEQKAKAKAEAAAKAAKKDDKAEDPKA